MPGLQTTKQLYEILIVWDRAKKESQFRASEERHLIFVLRLLPPRISQTVSFAVSFFVFALDSGERSVAYRQIARELFGTLPATHDGPCSRSRCGLLCS